MPDEATMKYICECMSPRCIMTVTLTMTRVTELAQMAHKVVIVDGCKHGPEPTDALVSKEDGYTIYQEVT